MTIDKLIDQASVPLFQYAVLGRIIPTVTFKFTPASNTSQTVYKMTLTGALIDSFSESIPPNGGLPTEVVSFKYSKITLTSTSFNSDGTPGPSTSGGWDLRLNRSV